MNQPYDAKGHGVSEVLEAVSVHGVGSGGMGGTFTPTLFMGIMLGSSFGYAANMLFPETTAPGGYALAGMAAFFGAAAHAPFTAIMVPFELSEYNHHMILPIMLTTVVATLVAQTISPHSMYTSSLVRQGIKVRRGAPGQELYVMDSITVGETMSKEIDTVPSTMPLFHLMEKFDQTHALILFMLTTRHWLNEVPKRQNRNCLNQN